MKSGICFVSPHIPPSFGGGGRRIYNIANYLANQGHKIDIITSTPNNNAIKNLNINVVSFPPLYSKNYTNKLLTVLIKTIYQPFIITQLFKYISKRRFKIIHIVGSRSGISFYSVLIAKLKGIKVINGTSGFGNDDPLTIKSMKYGFIRYIVHFKVPDIILNNSPLLSETCLKSHISKEKIKMIPNPVYEKKFYPVKLKEKNNIKRKLNLDQYKTIFLTVSLILPPKNIEEVIDVFEKCYKNDQNSILLIIGKVIEQEKYYYEKLKKIITEKGLNSSVIFYGESDKIPDIMRVSDYFLFTSKREGMPNVVLEAMSSGLPIIIKRIPEVTDIMFEDNNGIVYEVLEEGVNGALNLMNNPNLKKTISINARKTAVDKFSYPIIINEYLNLYKSLNLSGKGSNR